MPFPQLSFGNVVSLSAESATAAPPKRGSDETHTACHSPGRVLHNRRSAVLEQEVELAEPGQPLARTLGDVAVAPAVHLCSRESRDVAAEAVPDPVARAPPRDVA